MYASCRSSNPFEAHTVSYLTLLPYLTILPYFTLRLSASPTHVQAIIQQRYASNNALTEICLSIIHCSSHPHISLLAIWQLIGRENVFADSRAIHMLEHGEGGATEVVIDHDAVFKADDLP